MTIPVRMCSLHTKLPAACMLSACIAVASPFGAWAATSQTEAELANQLMTMSNEEIVRRLGDSGLSRAQVRDQLRRSGYDPYLADRYFDALSRGSEFGGVADAESIDAFRRIGLVGVGSSDELSASLGRPELAGVARNLADADSLARVSGPQVFGKGVFFHQSPRFDPFHSGPVGDDYVLGPGDAISLVLTGDVQIVHEQLNIARNGELFIPAVGLVSAQGRTLGELQDMLYVRLGQVYSGIRREAGATTRFSVSLASLRAIQVRVLGAVVRPGAYQLSSIGTFLEALYFAGGPTDEGTYRKLMLNRAGEEPVEIDLYPYLNSGNTSGDPRMRNGDVVFVPAVGKQATIRGPVRRQAVFELKEGEGLRDLIRFAGGVLPEASLETANVSRILPPSERSQEMERVVADVPLDSVLSGVRSFDIVAGDVVSLFPVSSRVRNTVYLRGDGVRRPAAYELQSGMTVRDVLERGGGLVSTARADRLRVLRLNRATGYYHLIDNQADLDVVQEEDDIVETFVHAHFASEDSVQIIGHVINPGRYLLAPGMTVSDMVLSAGGFLSDADSRVVDVVRSEADAEGRIRATNTQVWVADAFGDSGRLSPRSDNVIHDMDYVLESADRIYVRQSIERRVIGEVVIAGEVIRPGSYSLLSTDEKLSSMIARAGGLTPEANPGALQLRRRGILVGLDWTSDGAVFGGQVDPVIHAGDTITLPVVDNTVAATGSVNFPSRTVYRAGISVKDVLAEAGGTTQDADLNRTSVFYPDGNRSVVKRFLGIRRYPALEPGSTIFVPVKEEDEGADWSQALSTTATILQAVAVNILAIRSLTNQNQNQGNQGNQDDNSPNPNSGI